MIVRYYTNREKRAEMRCSIAPLPGDLVALSGVVFLVESRMWEFWNDDAEPILRVTLAAARGPNQNESKEGKS